jgi:hypothetical protein
MSKPKGQGASKPHKDRAAGEKKRGVEVLRDIGTGQTKCGCVEASTGIHLSFRDDEKACLGYVSEMGSSGLLQAFWGDAGSETLKSLVRTALLPYRQALIRELKLESTAELMLLDLAMLSYGQGLNFEFFTASATKDPETGHGVIKGKGDFVRVVSGIAYTSQFAFLLQTLVNLKKPPIQVRVERAGTVAVQVNEAGPAQGVCAEKPRALQLPDARDAVERVPAFTATERREPGGNCRPKEAARLSTSCLNARTLRFMAGSAFTPRGATESSTVLTSSPCLRVVAALAE